VGLFSFLSRKMKDPVEGTAQVVAASAPPYGVSGWSNCKLDLVVSAVGLEPYATSFTSNLTPTSKWPYAGQTLPVTVDRADPEHVKVEWDDVPTGDELGAAQAEQIAAAMRSGDASELPAGIPPEAAAIVDQITDMFPGATVVVNERVDARDGAADGGDDRVSQLERLAKLHEEGALTDAEFEVEKSRILGGA
jgi:hypothetical protein